MAFFLSFRVMITRHMCTRQTRQERPTQHSMSYNQLTIATAIVCFEWTFSRSTPAYIGCKQIELVACIAQERAGLLCGARAQGFLWNREGRLTQVQPDCTRKSQNGSHKCKLTICLHSCKLRAHIIVEPEVVEGWRPLLN